MRFLDAGRLACKFSNPALARLVRVGGPLALRLADLPGRMRRRRSLRLDSLERFDARFDALWERAKPQLGIMVRRDAEYLNCRYVAMPTHRHERLAAVTARGEAAGYVVWRSIPAGGGLVVWVLNAGWDPGQQGVLETLLLAVVAAAREEIATQVVCAAALPMLIGALRSLGFLRNRRDEFHMVSNWEGLFAQAEVTNIRRASHARRRGRGHLERGVAPRPGLYGADPLGDLRRECALIVTRLHRRGKTGWDGRGRAYRVCYDRKLRRVRDLPCGDMRISLELEVGRVGWTNRQPNRIP